MANNVNRWTEVTGNMTVFAQERGKGRNAFTVFSTSVGSKDESGKYKNLYFDVLFRKDNNPIELGYMSGRGRDNICEINVNKGFLTVRTYKDRDGNEQKKLAIMVLEYK